MYRRIDLSPDGVPQNYRGWAASPCGCGAPKPPTPSPTPSACDVRDMLLLGAVILVLLPRR